MEHIEIDWAPQYLGDNGFPQQATPLLHWWHYMQQASSATQKPMSYPANADALLTAVGFTDINHRTVRIPLHAPGDRRDWNLERRFKTAMCVGDKNAPNGFESLSMSLFTRQLRMSPAQVESLCDAVRRVCDSRELPLYFNMCVSLVLWKCVELSLMSSQTYLDGTQTEEIRAASDVIHTIE